MHSNLPSHYQPYLTAEQVQTIVAQMAQAVAPWARQSQIETGHQPLAICILRGAVFFFSDLLKNCPISIQPAFCSCRSYSSEVNGARLRELQADFLGADFAGRNVLLVDDICDSGRTLKLLAERVLKEGALSVKTATLIYRQRSDSLFRPDWFGVEYHGEEWFVGYGMEDKHHHMNLPGLYLIQPEA